MNFWTLARNKVCSVYIALILAAEGNPSAVVIFWVTPAGAAMQRLIPK